MKKTASKVGSGGRKATQAGETLKPIVSWKTARTGRELVAFFRASPLAQTDLCFERDPSTGGSSDFE